MFNLKNFSHEFQISNIKTTKLFLNIVETDVLEKAFFGLEKYRLIYSMNAHSYRKQIESVVSLMKGGWILCGMVVLQIHIYTQILCCDRFFRVINMVAYRIHLYMYSVNL